jgi:lipopolysaccharide transport system ATP-binding protein
MTDVSANEKSATTGVPMDFHVTHWKAGSQWVRAELRAVAPGRVFSPDHDPEWFYNQPLVAGAVYTPVYETYEKFRGVVGADAEQRTFVVIRDLRDTAVSWYFSLLHSHTLKDASVGDSRTILKRLNKTDGLALVISNHLRDAVAIQESWLSSGARIFRYEDLRADQQGEFARMLEYCGINVPESRRRAIVARNSFERKTWWRFGRESVKSHLRKGTAGDWKNHFCPRLKKLFKNLYGQTLIQAGYEKDLEW